MAKNEALSKTIKAKDNATRRLLLERHIERLAEMMEDGQLNKKESKNKTLVECYRER